MKRIAAAVTIVVALIAAGGAYAAINTYTAGISFTGRQAGTARKPVPMGYTENLKVSGTKGNRAGVQLVIKTRIYGLVEDGRDFPRCTAGDDRHGAHRCRVARRPRRWRPATSPPRWARPRTSRLPDRACDPELHVWNGGPGKLILLLRRDADASVPGRVDQDRRNAAISRHLQDAGAST